MGKKKDTKDKVDKKDKKEKEEEKDPTLGGFPLPSESSEEEVKDDDKDDPHRKCRNAKKRCNDNCKECYDCLCNGCEGEFIRPKGKRHEPPHEHNTTFEVGTSKVDPPGPGHDDYDSDDWMRISDDEDKP